MTDTHSIKKEKRQKYVLPKLTYTILFISAKHAFISLKLPQYSFFNIMKNCIQNDVDIDLAWQSKKVKYIRAYTVLAKTSAFFFFEIELSTTMNYLR